MGSRQSKSPQIPPKPNAYLRFDDFEVFRAIGRGAFGKVCLVEQKDSKKLFAMKYINKEACLKQRAVENIVAEVDLLRSIDHPFIVRLWFTFQDAEDLFIILEPLMGGDLRYHINNNFGNESAFNEEMVRFVIAEMASALDYLRSKNIVHRDVKPDNILLDELGHSHLTDFNVATYLNDEYRLKNMAGTKPYMAPEIYKATINFDGTSNTNGSIGNCDGYNFAVDWWSLGVTAFELKTAGRRPYDIGPKTSVTLALQMFESGGLVKKDFWPSIWSPEFSKVVSGLLEIQDHKRIKSLAMISKTKLMANMKFNHLITLKLPPPFIPKQEGLNCDPTYELEEMIIESKPLHKKNKRLLKQQQSLHSNTSPLSQNSVTSSDVTFLHSQKSNSIEDKFKSFPNYSREWEQYQDSLREKEKAWELELLRLMEASTLTAAATINNVNDSEKFVKTHGNGNETAKKSNSLD